ncbi:hypothetical protein LEP1GSC050_1590 [Leptospira broomii serovar Hurstbridge str. 5399]|uniref:Uncharacterized protein n=1 Tax=Leptospira broomii serovar Hurstbridge str. 5399 TaxID=1049789 RepID=T0F7G7_9LEPT|nr:hypothetical protein LEP1GSC050_1590 [Leptospira broomii serovar Hurstbridge str. 5399]
MYFHRYPNRLEEPVFEFLYYLVKYGNFHEHYVPYLLLTNKTWCGANKFHFLWKKTWFSCNFNRKIAYFFPLKPFPGVEIKPQP